MSTRIASNGPSQPIYSGEDRAEQAKANVKAQQTKAPNPTQVANWRATSNDAAASPLGRTAESWSRETLKQMPPGSKLEVSAELKVGELAQAVSKTGFEVERLEDGGFLVGKSEGGGVELSSNSGPNAEAALRATGEAKKTWRFPNIDQACDAVAALSQQELICRGYDRDQLDPDLEQRLAKLDSNVTSISVMVDAEVQAEAGYSTQLVGAEAGLMVTGSLTVSSNRGERTVTISEAIEGEERVTAKAGLNAGVVEMTGGHDVASITMSSKLETTFHLTVEQQARFDSGKGRAVISEMMERGIGTRKLSQHFEARLGDQAATAKREVVLNDQLGLIAALHPGNLELGWVANGGVIRSTSKLDVHVAELELESKLRLPGEEPGHANLGDVARMLGSKLSNEQTVELERARANVRH